MALHPLIAVIDNWIIVAIGTQTKYGVWTTATHRRNGHTATMHQMMVAHTITMSTAASGTLYSPEKIGMNTLPWPQPVPSRWLPRPHTRLEGDFYASREGRESRSYSGAKNISTSIEKALPRYPFHALHHPLLAALNDRGDRPPKRQVASRN